MTIEEKIKNFIAQNLLFSDNGYNLPEEVSYLEEGIVDSIGVLELVTYVEEQFGITVKYLDVTLDNFDSRR